MESELPRSSSPTGGYARNESMDICESHMHVPRGYKGPPVGGIPSHPSHHYGRGGSSYGFAPPPYPSSRAPIKSVVTTSFEEREDRLMERRDPAGSYYRDCGVHHGRSPPRYDNGREDYQAPYPYPMEADPYHDSRDPRMYARDLPPIREGDFEGRHPPHEMMRPAREIRTPPSPREEAPYINRSFSNASSVNSSFRGGPLKRSFWHHARSGDEVQALPNDFLPPKRSKVTPQSGNARREYTMTARTATNEEVDRYQQSRSPGWFNRAMSWEASRDDYCQRDPSNKVYTGSWSSRSPPSNYHRDERMGSRWGDAPCMPSPHERYSEPGYPMSPPIVVRWSHPDDRGWGIQGRDECESRPMYPERRDHESYEAHMHRQGTFESEVEPPVRFIPGPPQPRGKDGPPSMHMPLDMLPMPVTERPHNETLLLSFPEDRISLSETLCLVRENVEVFEATLEDVEAPAPGRKHAVSVGQVGLRCIHCRHTTRSSDRVKRAVCYPSSIKRIYRTVIDMKLDHFLHCKFVPKSLKDTLNALKANNTRSTGTTMQYFIRAAGNLGLVDSPDGNGVRMIRGGEYPPTASAPEPSPSQPVSPLCSTTKCPNIPVATPDTDKKSPPSSESLIHRKDSITSIASDNSNFAADDTADVKEHFTGHVPLAIPEDKNSLSPLRCFLREQVMAFSATKEDVAVRTPTTFSVTEGQVGIACIHCFGLASKMRLNRAVCFPFSIARIYQSVADIQRFHLADCNMAPAEVKEKFNQLQGESSKGSKGLATRQYWVTSAKKIGLVDTEKGIRFGRDPSIPEEKSPSLDILAQVASHVNSVNRPLVLPEDKPLVAEFLYVVMEQLQACRFTEADRNKRRLKNIGCIGVECKHCAGQVDSRKFFWSSVNAVESNFVSVHTHVMECKKAPEELKENLADLKKLRKEQTAALKTGSQKSFFSRVWERLNAQEKAAEAAAKEKLAELTQQADSEKEEAQAKTLPQDISKEEQTEDVNHPEKATASSSVPMEEEREIILESTESPTREASEKETSEAIERQNTNDSIMDVASV